MGQYITELGYIGLEVSDVTAWCGFAQNVLGLEARPLPAGGAKLRMDARDYRLLLLPGPADDIAFAGWRTEDEAALHGHARGLDERGITYRWLGAEELAVRGIGAALAVTDPQGLRHEVYAGDPRNETPFASTLVGSGFVTGLGGLGHVVFGTSTYAASKAFAETVLEAKLSDIIVQPITPDINADVTFMHVNERHHSIAFADRGGGKRLHHFMIEVGAVDDVGRARDRHLVEGLLVAQDIGQHPNDQMISYYGVTPSGFLVEFGWGGRKIDDAVWQPGRYARLSEWGHRPYGAMPRDAKAAAAKSAAPEEATMHVDGDWTLTLNTPMGAQISKLSVIAADGILTGSFETPGGDVALRDGTLHGAVLSWKADMTAPFAMTLTFALTMDGDTLTGTAESIMGKIPVTGLRG